MEQSPQYVIEMLHITKEFPGIKANDDITLQLRKGEIHALLGENGAGKSTLMSVLFGLYQAEEGEIRKDGKVVSIKNPNDANSLGIGMVHQHFKLVECFTVLDNIIMGVEPTKHGFLQKGEARKKVLALSEKYGLQVDPDARIEDITVGMQQRTEILKMLYRDNEILIFDEPTAVLTPQEISELMQIMRGLAAEGKSILFISHKLQEIMAVADRCTVLRKGKCIGTVETKNTTAEQLSAMMVGRSVNFHVEKKASTPGDVLLDVQHLTVASRQHKNDAVHDVSFQVRAGEIVCIAGIDGNGQSELIYGLTGLSKLSSGKLTLDGKDITGHKTIEINKEGVARTFQNIRLFKELSVLDNVKVGLHNHHPYSAVTGILRLPGYKKGEKEMDEKAMELLKVFGLEEEALYKASNLPYGKQRKLEIARALATEPKLLLLDEPAAGMNPNETGELMDTIRFVRDEFKMTILLIEHDMKLVSGICEELTVLNFGQILAQGETSEVLNSPQVINAYLGE